jgi:hypothetical protein
MRAVTLERTTRRLVGIWTMVSAAMVAAAMALTLAAGGQSEWSRWVLGAVAISGMVAATRFRVPLHVGVLAGVLMLAIVPHDAGNCTIPTDATGVSLNVTAVAPTAASFMTIFPSDASLPAVSNLNYLPAAPPTPNKVDVKLSADDLVEPLTSAGLIHDATVTGDDPNGTEVTDTDPVHFTAKVPMNPSIDIEKYVNWDDADTPPGPWFFLWDPPWFDYHVENDGDTVLTDIAVVDSILGPISCPLTTLLPGQSIWCDRQHRTAEHLGPMHMASTVTGVDPDGNTVSDSDPAYFYVKKAYWGW